MTIVWGEGPSGRSAQIVDQAVSDLDQVIQAILVWGNSPPNAKHVAAKLEEVNKSLKLLKEHYKTKKDKE